MKMKRNLVITLLFLLLAASVADVAYGLPRKKKSKKHAHRHQHDKDQDKEQSKDKDEDASGEVKEGKVLKKEQKKKQKKDRKKKKQEQKEKKRQEKLAKENSKKGKAKKDSGKKTPDATAVVLKKQDKEPPHTKKKNRYRVDVFAPMYLDELVKEGSATYKDKIPEKAMPGVAFYAGLSIAADSLKKEGFNIDIYVHDVSSPSESAEKLTSSGAMESTDLIVGAVLPNDIPVLADYAKKNSVNFISTMSASDAGVKDNPYFTMMQPSLKTHCEWIVNDIATKFPKERVALLYQTKGEGNNNAYDYITDAHAADNIKFKYLACNTQPKRANFDLVVDPGKTNVIIVSILETGFADTLLHELSRDYPGTHFEVYGMPSWISITDLRKEGGMPNLSVNITTPFVIDPTTTVGQYVKMMYKANYSGKISESVYRGYETMFWYAYLLKRYGTHFSEKYSDNVPAPFTQFDIKPEVDKKGNVLFYENKHIFLSTYESGVYKVKGGK